MKAIKANRVYTITETDKESFQKEGFDIYDDNGNIVAYGAGKMVSYQKYVDLLVKYETLEKEFKKLVKSVKESEEKKPEEKKSEKKSQKKTEKKSEK